jgi:hypothetical protein
MESGLHRSIRTRDVAQIVRGDRLVEATPEAVRDLAESVEMKREAADADAHSVSAAADLARLSAWAAPSVRAADVRTNVRQRSQAISECRSSKPRPKIRSQNVYQSWRGRERLTRLLHLPQ